MRNKILVFHHSDLDGMGVKLIGMLYARVNNLEVETFKCDYGDVDQIISDRIQDLESVVMILIGDISVQSENLAEKLNEIHKQIPVHLRDHHATATWLNKYRWAKVREKDDEGVYRCGTYWTAKAFMTFITSNYPDSSIKEFVNLVDLYDTWKWMDDPENPIIQADNLNSVFKMIGEEKFTDLMLGKLTQGQPIFDDLANTLIEVRTRQIKSKAQRLEKNMKEYNLSYRIKSKDQLYELLKYYEDTYGKESSMLKDAYQKFYVGYDEVFKVGIVFEGADISDVGNIILGNRPDLDILIFVSLPKLMSYRTRKNLSIPLGLMSKYITGFGGGHAQAAGGSIHPDLYDKILRQIIPSLTAEIKEVQND